MTVRVLAFLALVAVAACSAEARYQRIVDHSGAPGAQLAVIEPGGGAWFGAGGNAREGEGMTAEHRLLIGSNTKVWTAAIVLQLVDAGALDLDASASELGVDVDAAITVRDLLQHTSGLGEYFEHADMAGHTDRAWTPAELINLGREVRDDGPSASVYANTNYVALGVVIEEVEGRPYAESLHARVLDPLAMDDSGLVTDPGAMPDRVAWGDGGTLGSVTPEHPSVGWSAGAGFSTAADLAHFYDALFSGELYGEGLVEAQLDATPADLGFDEDDLTTAYGLGLMHVGVGGQEVTGHLGTVTGFNALGVRDDATGAIAVVLGNGSEITVVRPTLKALQVAGKR